MVEEIEVKQFIPPLVTLLIRAEELKESALSETEVLRIRDSAEFMVVPESVAKATAEQRGYDDIPSDDIWNSWLQIREMLNKSR